MACIESGVPLDIGSYRSLCSLGSCGNQEIWDWLQCHRWNFKHSIPWRAPGSKKGLPTSLQALLGGRLGCTYHRWYPQGILFTDAICLLDMLCCETVSQYHMIIDFTGGEHITSQIGELIRPTLRIVRLEKLLMVLLICGLWPMYSFWLLWWLLIGMMVVRSMRKWQNRKLIFFMMPSKTRLSIMRKLLGSSAQGARHSSWQPSTATEMTMAFPSAR